MKRISGVTCVCLLLLTQAFGQSSKKQKQAPQPTTVTLTAAVPSLAPLAESLPSQLKGGLRITVEPELFKAVDSMTTQRRQVQPSGIIIFKPSPNAIYVEESQVPQFKLNPNRLIFHIRLNNQLPRVFRGSGIVVQFNAAGKAINVDPSGYGDLVNVIIPPRSEQEVTVIGPPVESIAAPCTVGLFLYDVVTATDAGGNVTEKQNFEWYFSYQTQVQSKDFVVPPPQRGWVTP